MSRFQTLFIDKAREIAMFAFLFTVPIFMAVGGDSRVMQEMYFHAACLALGSLFFGNIWLTLFMWLNLVLFVLAGGEVGSQQVLSVFLTGILFACSRTFFSKYPFKNSAKALYIVAVLSILLMICQVFRVDPFNLPVNAGGEVESTQASSQMSGLFYLPPFNGIFLTIVASIFLFLNSWIGFLFIIPVWLTKCSAAFLAWAFLIPFWFYQKKIKIPVPQVSIDFKKKEVNIKRPIFINALFPVIILGISLFGVYTFHDFKTDKLTYLSRFENWSLVLKQTAGSYFLGYGPDSFRNTNKLKNFLFKSDRDYNPMIETRIDDNKSLVKYYSANNEKWKERFEGKTPPGFQLVRWDEAHNDYLELFFQYGVLGLVLLFFMFKEIYDRFKVSDKTPEVLALFACLCVYALTATTQFPFHLARIAGIFGIILGAYWSATDKNYKLIKGEENVY